MIDLSPNMIKLAFDVAERAKSLYPHDPVMQQKYIRHAMQDSRNRTAENYAALDMMQADRAAPIAGINGQTQADADAFWAKRQKELEDTAYRMFGSDEEARNKFIARRKASNPHKWDREKSEAFIRAGVEDAKKGLKKNTGFLASFKSGGGYNGEKSPLGNGVGIATGAGTGAFIGGPVGAIIGAALGMVNDAARSATHRSQHVNKSWMDNYNQYSGADEVQAARDALYRQTANEAAGKMIRKQDRQLAAWNHIEGNIFDSIPGIAVNPVLRHLPGDKKYKDWSDLVTGRSTTEHASAYGEMAADEFGDDKARKYERNLRFGGLGANILGTVALGIATSGMGTAAKGAATSVKASQGAASALSKASKTLSAAEKALNAAKAGGNVGKINAAQAAYDSALAAYKAAGAGAKYVTAATGAGRVLQGGETVGKAGKTLTSAMDAARKVAQKAAGGALTDAEVLSAARAGKLGRVGKDLLDARKSLTAAIKAERALAATPIGNMAAAGKNALSPLEKLKLFNQANFIQNAGQAGIMTLNRSRKLHQFSNLMNVGKETVTTGGKTEDPRLQAAGATMGVLGEIAPLMSYEHAGSYVMGKLAPVVGGAVMAAGGGQIANSGVGKAIGAAINNPVTNWVADTRAGKAIGDSLRSGVIVGVQNNFEDMMAGTKPNFSPINYSGMIGFGAMLSKPMLKGLLSKNDHLATMIQAGAASAEQQASIDEIMKDPAAVNAIREQIGAPAATDDEIRGVLPDIMAAQRRENTYNSALYSLDSKFDWNNATPEQIQAHMASIPKEQRQKAFYDAYRKDVVMGGVVDPSMFADENLTQDQRKQLLGMYLQSEDNANGGTLIGQMFRGEKNVAVSAMQKSPSARRACVMYAAGVVQDFMNNPEGNGMSQLGDTAKAVLQEMSPQEQAQALSPLLSLPPQKLIDMQKNQSFASDPVIAEAGKNAIMERLRTDGNFAAEFIPAYTKSMQEGVGITDADAQRVRDMVSSIDPQEFLGTMDDDHFADFSRWMMSNKGGKLMDDMPEEQRYQLEEGFKQAAKARAWQAFKNNPFKAIPNMAGIWLQSQGYDGMSSFASDPMAFWGTLATLLVGSVWAGKKIFSDDDTSVNTAEFVDDASALSNMKRQRELLMQM